LVGDIAPTNRQTISRCRRFPSWDLENFRLVVICRLFTQARSAPTTHSRRPSTLSITGLENFFGLRNFFGLGNFFSFSFSRHPPLYRKSIDVPGSNCTDLLISERVAGFSLKLGRDRPSLPPTVHSQSPVLKIFGLRNFFSFSFSTHPPLYRKSTVRICSFPRGSPALHSSSVGTDPLICRPFTLNHRS